MFAYYLNLALRSFRRNPVLTLLMVLTIATGIGATMTTLTLYYVLSSDPIPHKSRQLFYPRLEPRSLAQNGRLEAEPERAPGGRAARSDDPFRRRGTAAPGTR